MRACGDASSSRSWAGRRYRPRTATFARLAAAGLVALLGSACGGTSSLFVTGSEPPGATPAATPAASGEMTIYAPGGTYTSVSPWRLAEMLEPKDFVLVNVHVPYEGEIEGTDAFLPYDQLANRLSELPVARSATIVVYCRSGRMSALAARTLVGLGYAKVLELDGGMIAWEAAGYTLIQRPGG